MTKHRVTLTTVIEYEVLAEAYPAHFTDVERAEYDREAYDDDPGLALSDDTAEHTVTVEVLP